MKYFTYLIFAVSGLFFILSGCDSATDSKPVSVTPPALTTPADRDSNVVLTPTFKWTGNADKIQIDKSNNTFTDVVISADVTGNSYTTTQSLLPNHTYYWHAGISAGTTVYWSTNTFSFRTKY